MILLENNNFFNFVVLSNNLNKPQEDSFKTLQLDYFQHYFR